ncbi:MAG: PIG-L family deacetylase [Armatimonadetes bacterium]|nr:PIG-L family deacetylase [Armatimonadota bacterium]
MSVFDYSKRRWLFCMTHPDDEISICLWMKKLIDNGNEVFVSWTHSTPVREAESRKVSEQLGIPQENLFFHLASDGIICTEFRDLLPRFREIMSTVKPDVVACGAFEQGHVDHDTTNVLVNLSFDGPVLEIPFYHTYATRLQVMNAFSDPTGQSVLDLSSDEQRLKRQIAKLYRSQNIWSVLLWFEIWQVAQGRRTTLSSRETMRLQQHKLFRLPNHPAYVAALVERCDKWHWWCDHVLPYVPG